MAWRNRKPSLRGGTERRILPRIPLHRRPLTISPFILGPSANTCQIANVGKRFRRCCDHPDFLAVIDQRHRPRGQQNGGNDARNCCVVLSVPISISATRVIVIVEYK